MKSTFQDCESRIGSKRAEENQIGDARMLDGYNDGEDSSCELAAS